MKARCTTLLLLLFLSLGSQAAGQVVKLKDWQKAVAESKRRHQNILIILTGKEWCAPCKLLEKNIIQNNIFAQYAAANLVVFEINIPRSHLTKDTRLVKEYNGFRDRYEAKAMPSLILVDSAGSEKAKVLNTSLSADSLISILQAAQRAR
jgi:thioredoxin-related protein